MTTAYRSRLLGDTEDGRPARLGRGAARAPTAVHVLLLLYADTADRLRARCAELTAEAGRRPPAAAPAADHRADADRALRLPRRHLAAHDRGAAGDATPGGRRSGPASSCSATRTSTAC